MHCQIASVVVVKYVLKLLMTELKLLTNHVTDFQFNISNINIFPIYTLHYMF